MGRRKIEIGFNAGNVIRILAQDYSTVQEVIEQYVQNLLDAKAREAIIFVNLKSKSIEALDNGKGASEAEFTRNVQEIGKSEKSADDVGGKGVGNLASIGIMGKNGEYKFTTRPKSRSRATNPFFTASLKYDDLRDAGSVDFIFEDHPSSFSFNGYKTPDGRDVSRYTTRVKTTHIEPTALAQIAKNPGALKDICEEIGGQYAAAINKLGTKISIAIIGGASDGIMEVQPQEFKGWRETPVIIETRSGPVKFEMFTTTTKEKPRIWVRHQGVYDISLKSMEDIWAEYLDVFESGYINGYIHLGFCETNAQRSGFVWGDELQDFIEAIDNFANTYARDWLKKLKKSERLNKIQESIQNAVSILDKFIKNNPSVLSGSLRGAISDGHKPKRGKKTVVRMLGPRRQQKKSKLPRAAVPRLVGSQKKMKHISGQHSKGSDRTVVRGESGVTVMHMEPDPLTEDINWLYKIDGGIIYINISHKLFKIHSDKSKNSMNTYVLELIRAALSEAKIRDERGELGSEGWRQYFESFHVHHVDMMI